MARPSFDHPGSGKDRQMVVRFDDQLNRLVVVDLRKRGGKHRIISAYFLTLKQIEQLMRRPK
jgi:hypothetical protein